MQAWVQEEYGGAEVLALRDIPQPTLKPDEVLVRIHATVVSRTDCHMLTAKPFIMRLVTGFIKPRRPVPGCSFAGVVTAVAPQFASTAPATNHNSPTKATRPLLAVGDRVFGFSDMGVSSYAEQMALSSKVAVGKIPDQVSFENAAACIEGGHYFLNFMRKIPSVAGKSVLVNGATGAIGSAAVQLLRHAGARVTAVANGKNLELVRRLGAVDVINYETDDFTQTTQRFQVVCDTVGKSSFARCKHLLEPGGIYMSGEMGWLAQNFFLPTLTRWFGRFFDNKRVLFPFPTATGKSVSRMRQLLDSGDFEPVIDRTHPLTELPEAVRYVMKKEKTGNVVISLE